MNSFNLSNEGVKCLCKFMGIDAMGGSGDLYTWSDSPYYITIENDYHKCIENVYRYVGERKVNDWGFVMSVVERIESMEDVEMGRMYNVQIEQDFVVIVDNSSGDDIVDVDGEDKLSAVVHACISFVMWYVKNGDK